MSILDYFTDWQDVQVTQITRNGDFDPNTGRTTVTESELEVGKVIFYVGSQAESFFAEKLREQIDATAIFNTSVNIKNEDHLKILDETYTVVYVDDVALRNEAKVVALKKET